MREKNNRKYELQLSCSSDTLDSLVHKVTEKDKDAGMYFGCKWILDALFPEIDGELKSFLLTKYIPGLFNR